MPAITIMAEVNGAIVSATIQVDKIDWAPLDPRCITSVDGLPRKILEIDIHTNRGVFRQIFPKLVEELEERTSWWRWWKDL